MVPFPKMEAGVSLSASVFKRVCAYECWFISCQRNNKTFRFLFLSKLQKVMPCVSWLGPQWKSHTILSC